MRGPRLYGCTKPRNVRFASPAEHGTASGMDALRRGRFEPLTAPDQLGLPAARAVIYLFWDIDGTLLTTARAGIHAWEEAAAEVLGEEMDLFADWPWDGFTDHEIAVAVGARGGRDEDVVAARLLDSYTRRLPHVLDREQGRVMPNARECLAYFDARDDAVNMLLTGNVEQGARAKLGHYGLWDFFAERGGAFCVEGSDRPTIARAARELAAEHEGRELAGEEMIVIGDTPHDVACGLAIGAITVAVATLAYDAEQLRAAGATHVSEELPAPGRLAELVGLAG